MLGVTVSAMSYKKMHCKTNIQCGGWNMKRWLVEHATAHSIPGAKFPDPDKILQTDCYTMLAGFNLGIIKRTTGTAITRTDSKQAILHNTQNPHIPR
jgi:hypothetical protein